MAIFRDGQNAIRHLSIVILDNLDKIEPDKDVVYLFCDCGMLAQRRGNVRASADRPPEATGVVAGRAPSNRELSLESYRRTYRRSG